MADSRLASPYPVGCAFPNDGRILEDATRSSTPTTGSITRRPDRDLWQPNPRASYCFEAGTSSPVHNLCKTKSMLNWWSSDLLEKNLARRNSTYGYWVTCSGTDRTPPWAPKGPQNSSICTPGSSDPLDLGFCTDLLARGTASRYCVAPSPGRRLSLPARPQAFSAPCKQAVDYPASRHPGAVSDYQRWTYSRDMATRRGDSPIGDSTCFQF
jgi:hypothetical protein